MVKGGKATAAEVTALACNYHTAGLSAADVAMLDYAAEIALDPERISETDIAELRSHGFSDVNILDIALNASYRVFVTRMAAALGLEGEEWFAEIAAPLRETLTVGRRL
jgi:alkylhydroperoxidase family enzyme